jgi:hypothetical protein
MTSSSLLLPDTLIVDSFPTPSLPIIQGELALYPQLATIPNALKADAAYVPRSNQGGGANAYLGIILPNVVYSTIAPGNSFLTPTNPTQHPMIPCNSKDAATSTIIQ